MSQRQIDMFDLIGAREARDLGIARVESKAQTWVATGLARIADLPSGYEGIAEEICGFCRLGKAPSPGAVGALIHRARKRGYLIRTGKMRSPRCVKSHARETYVWRRA
jgi:hypothetical protein